MELIRITDQKLKIMLTPSDISLYELNNDSPDTDHSPRGIRRLLVELRQRFGVHFDDSRISAQYFPSKSGGGELFVCSIQPKSGDDRKKTAAPKAVTPLPVATGRTVISGFRWEGAYRFDSLDDLLSACHRLRGVDFIGESEVYAHGNHTYYLFLHTYSPAPFSIPEEISFLSEYGKAENASALRMYVLEHGTLIRSPDAISVLAALK